MRKDHKAFRYSKLLWWAVLLPPAILILAPAAMLLISSLRDAPPGAAGTWTLGNYLTVLGSHRVWSVALTTLWIALTSTAISLSTGIFMAWLVTRTDVPGRQVLASAAVIPFLAPGLVVAIGWAILGNPDNGVLNEAVHALTHGHEAVFNVYSYGGVALVMSFPASGFIYLMMVGPLSNMDPSLEDSARLSGASRWQILRRIQVPLIMPAFFPFAVLAFIRAIEAFEVPQILGTPAGIYVFINYIYDALKVKSPPHYGEAIALSVIIGTAALVMVALQAHVQHAAATVTGRGFQPRRNRLGRWRIPCAVIAWTYLGLVLLPLGAIAVSSFWRYLGNFDPALFTFENYTFIAGDATTRRAVFNTIALMLIASTACVVIGSIVSFTLLRKIKTGRRSIEAIFLIPWAVPGLILGVALLWTYINVPGLYGTFTAVLLGFITLGIPLAMRSTSSVLEQISPDLEEAGMVHGGNVSATIRRIVVPLIFPSLVAAWFTLATLFSRELSVSVMLYGYGSEVTSVQLLSYWEQGHGTRVAALSVLLVVFVFGLYVAQQRLTRSPHVPMNS